MTNFIYHFNFYVFHTNLLIKYTGILVIQYEVRMYITAIVVDGGFKTFFFHNHCIRARAHYE